MRESCQDPMTQPLLADSSLSPRSRTSVPGSDPVLPLCLLPVLLPHRLRFQISSAPPDEHPSEVQNGHQ
ncbi:hypothetical protein M514_24647 [Trichuris suis]|uniref:Uncharacterized protein n=1 Tax=Trichuris suis TaxID=68888 RepID=A0A085N126_9BILA|nr:hypothetical protein M514_24647 [Trichuris suis]